MKRNIKTFLSARPLCCYLIAAITLALSFVSCNDEWKYAVIEFTPEFITELIGPARDRALPACEVMVRRAGSENIDEGFVTRLKLRQILREKNIVIADVLTDWQQKPVMVGDVVFY